jgi:hypothetical protein
MVVMHRVRRAIDEDENPEVTRLSRPRARSPVKLSSSDQGARHLDNLRANEADDGIQGRAEIMQFRRVLVGAALGMGVCLGPGWAQENPVREQAAATPEDREMREHSAGVREDARVWTLEELRNLEANDPAGFQDLLRRSLAARLLWDARRAPLPPDLPLELAGR